MTTNRDFDRLASSWLASGPTELNDRVLEAALDEVHLTHQRRRVTVPWRNHTLSTFQRLAAAIAVFAIVGVAGLKLFGDGATGATGPSAAPVATPSPTTSGSAAPTASATSTARTFPRGGTRVTAGSYRAGAPFLLPNLTFEVPPGWNSHSGVQSRVVSLTIGSPTQAGSPAAFLYFEVPLAVYADPCQTGRAVPVPNLGPSVDDFVSALSTLPMFTVGPVTDVLVDGLPGKAFDLTNAIPSNGTSCPGDDGLIHVWDTGDVGGDTLPGLRQHLVVADVDGTRLVIEVLYTDPTRPFDDDIEAIISSVRFE